MTLRHPARAFSPLAPRWLAQVMSSNDTPVPWWGMTHAAAFCECLHELSAAVRAAPRTMVGDE